MGDIYTTCVVFCKAKSLFWGNKYLSMKAIILAGGAGTRLRPMSTEDCPKQFLEFGSEGSFLQKTVQRLLQGSFIDEIVISTHLNYAPLVQEQLRQFGSIIKILVEPCRKNTAPAIALAIKYLEQYCSAKPTDAILVAPSDHLIEPEAVFLNAVEQMEEKALTGKIITFGIRPTKPETGYGYIEMGDKVSESTYKAVRFVEKPDQTLAEELSRDPRYFWNSGIFLFSIDAFWRQLKMHAIHLHKVTSCDFAELIGRFDALPNLSWDDAVMEKTNDILISPLNIFWSDVGSWDSVYELLQNKRLEEPTIWECFL